MFQEYFNTIQELYLSDTESTEHTYRTALENLLNSFLKENISKKLIIKHEPKKQGDLGRPDFKVSTPEQLTIGLIETKKTGDNLKETLNSEQLLRYKQLSENIIVTDYLQFFLIRKGDPVLEVQLFKEDNIQHKASKLEKNRIEDLIRLLNEFFEAEPEIIKKSNELAGKLAVKARFLRDFCQNEMYRKDDTPMLLRGIYNAFKESLLPELSYEYFSDIYAQTISYSLFLTALNCNDPRKTLTKYSVFQLLPNSFPLIKELFHRIDDFPAEIQWIIEEIITILKATDFYSIKQEFSFYRQKEKRLTDPFIYFYEDFLFEYDPEQRKIRGVYYTPESVVSFIVRSIDIVLKEKFGLKDGFINDNVTLLDFATGTGTFLLSAFNQALTEAQKIGDKEIINRILNERIINNFYGFELLVAPYVVAHLKISEYFKEMGFSLDEGKRLNIFLTNTLHNKEPKPFDFMPYLSREGKAANEIKNKDILVILGNPPYSVSSCNKTGFITEEKLLTYKETVKHEKNIQPLSDDYIKFIRFAHWKMEKVEKGAIGIITNNSFLDGLIHRGMRRELAKVFDEIYVLNLHGNSRIGEKCPDGSKDENVFAIMQGVSISIFVKKDKSEDKETEIYYADLYGLKQKKYDFLEKNDIKTLMPVSKSDSGNLEKWSKLKPQKDFFFFVRKDFSSRKQYEKGFKIDEIFKKFSSGVKTHRDHFVVDIRKENLERRILAFYESNEIEALSKFKISDTRDWKIKDALSNGFFNKEFICPYTYKPFDIRNIYYDINLIDKGTSRFDNVTNITKDNYALLLMRRIIPSSPFSQVSVTNNFVDINYFGFQTYFFPLYTKNGKDNTKAKKIISSIVCEPALPYKSGDILNKIPNFTKEFIHFINHKFNNNYSPEQILGYIYAVLHSPAYRNKYIEFLKIDFPRIPFTDDKVLFEKLAFIGCDLIEHHLMKRSYDNYIYRMQGEGRNFAVESIKYENGKLWINKDRYFEGINEEIWNYFIGGYQVLDKWLKERKKYKIVLSGEDTLQFIKIVNILDYTLKTMQEIDELTMDWI